MRSGKRGSTGNRPKIAGRPAGGAGADLKPSSGSKKHVRLTEKRQKNLKEVRELFETVAANMQDGLAVVDWDGAILYANKAAYRIVGLRSRKKPAGLNMAEVIHPDDLPRAVNELMMVRDGKGGFLAQYRVVTPRGEFRWIETVGQKVSFRGQESSLITLRDMTRRKLDEEALKKGEERLKLSEKKFAEAFHSSPLAISISDPRTGALLDVNEAYETLTGFSHDELTSDINIALGLWADPSDRERYIRELQTSHKIEGFHATLRKKDGSNRDVVLSASVIRVGGMSHLQTIVHDITDQKRMEEALKENEERYRRITSAITDYIYTVFLEQGKVVRTVHSPACEAVTGYTPEDFDQNDFLWYSMVEEEDRELVREHFNRVTTGERVHPIEHRIRRKDGSVRWVSNMPVIHRDAQGVMISYDGVISDITERKLAEKEIRERQARLDSIFRVAPAGIGVVVDRVLQDVNERICEMTGHSREELEGQSARILYPTQEEYDFVGTEKYRQISEKGTGSVETRWRRKDGTIIHIILSSTPIDPENNSAGITFTALDITERKRSEEALKESEERYRLMAELTGKLVYDYDISSGRMTWHGALSQLTGFLPEEFGAVDMKVWNAMLHPEDRVGTIMTLEDALREGGPYQAEYRLCRKDGSYIYVEDHGVFLQDASGKAFRMLGSIGDITERMKALEDLRESEERYHSLFDTSHAVMLLIEPETGRIIDANPAACAYYGYTRQELTSREITEINTLTPDEVFTEMERARSLKRRSFIFRHRLADGTIRDVEVFSGPIVVSGRTLLYSIVHDITERRQVEEALKEREERFRSMIQNSADIIVILDGNGNISYETPSLSRVLGYTDGYLEGRTPLDFMHPDDRDRVAHDLGEVYQGINEGLPTEFRFRKADGTWTHLEAIGSNLMNHPGINGVVITARDITDRKKAEELRLEMERRLLHAQRLESLGVMAGGIAHDFNNLLMAILGNLDLAQLDLSAVSRSRPFIDHALVAARRAADLTNQMLAYSGKGRFDLKTFDLSELVEEMSHLLKASISKTVTLNLQTTRGLPLIKADPGQIQQIIMNLIVNASEAIGDAPGVVGITTDLMKCTEDHLKQSRLKEKPQSGDYVFFEVKDTGCGMDGETMDRLFDPFFTTKFTGRGLGLAAVSGIITGHRGAIMVDSEPGRGTTIRVLLPVSPEQPRGAARGKARAGKKTTGEGKEELPRGTVLVVDDEEMVRDLCRSMVERLGFNVVTASDGEEAVKVFQENAADVICVILDLTMPRKDGMEAFDELKRMDEKVRVILSSGFNEQETTQRFLGKGLAGFIKKPYRLETLRKELERVLNDG